MKNTYLIFICLLTAFKLTAQNVYLAVEHNMSGDEKEFVTAYFLELDAPSLAGVQKLRLYNLNNYTNNKELIASLSLTKSNTELKLQHQDFSINIQNQWEFATAGASNDVGINVLDFFVTAKEQERIFFSEDDNDAVGIYYNVPKIEIVGWRIGNKEITIVPNFPVANFLRSPNYDEKVAAQFNNTVSDSVVCAVINHFGELPIDATVHYLSTTWVSKNGKDLLRLNRMKAPFKKGDMYPEIISIEKSKRPATSTQAVLSTDSNNKTNLTLRWHTTYYLSANGDTVFQTAVWEYGNKGWKKSYTIGDYPLPVTIDGSVLPLQVFDANKQLLKIIPSDNLSTIKGNNSLFRLYRKDGALYADMLVLNTGHLDIELLQFNNQPISKHSFTLSSQGLQTLHLGSISSHIKSVHVKLSYNKDIIGAQASFQHELKDVSIDK